MLLLVLVDGWLAGSLGEVVVESPADAEVGQPATVTVRAMIERDSDARAPQVALGFDPRLGEHGTARLTLAGTRLSARAVAEGLDGTLGIQLDSCLEKGDLSADDLRAAAGAFDDETLAQFAAES